MARLLPRSPRYRLALLGLVGALFTGCGGNGGVPVSGKVTTADGAAVTSGSVRYVPDKAKGNNLPTEPVGQIGADGTYQIATNGKPGAPPGVYKVVVFVSKPSKSNDPYAAPVSLINKKYNTPTTTDLVVEVKDKASPGAYDLKLIP